MVDVTLGGGHRRAGRILAAATIALLVLVVGSAMLLVRADATQRHALEERFEARRATASEFVRAYVAELAEREQRLAVRMFVGDVSPSLFDAEVAKQGFTAGVLLDSQGRLLAAKPNSPRLLGADMAGRFTHLAAAGTGEPTVSNVVRSIVSGELIVGFAVPFQAADGTRVFSGAYAVDETPLGPLVRHATPFRTGQVFIVDSTGRVVAGNAPRSAGRWFAAVRPALGAVKGPAGYADAPSGRQFVTQGQITGTPWRLVYAVDEDELFGPLHSPVADWLRWGGLATVLLLGLSALAVLYRYLVQRDAMVESGVRHHAILDTANDAFIGMDQDGQVTDWNLAAETLFGYSPGEAIGRLLGELIVPPEHQEAHRAGTARFVETGHPTRPGQPQRLRATRADRSSVEVEMMLSRVHTEAGWRFYAFLRDITERVEHESLLQRLALTDGLTGLANRRAVVDRLEQALAAGARRGAPVAVVYVDVDKFKSINDRYGHAVGDGILRTVAERLRMTFRLEDTVARMGGDEFVVICENLGASSDLHVLIRRVRFALSQPYLVDGQRFDVTASVGLAVSEGDTSVERLLHLADAEMYQAKATQQAFAAVVKAI